MDITFCIRSRFLDACEDAIRLGRAELDTGGTLRLLFEHADIRAESLSPFVLETPLLSSVIGKESTRRGSQPASRLLLQHC